MNRMIAAKKGARLVLAGLLGYFLIVSLTTAGFNGWLAGADLYRGGTALRAKGVLVALVAGLAGGSLAALIGGRRPVSHALAILPLVIADTIYVLFVFDGAAPSWFELIGGLTLMTSTLAGGLLVALVRRRHEGMPRSSAADHAAE